jgi:hypothetical protein
MTNKVNTSFIRHRDGDLVNIGYLAADSIKDNTLFPNPNPTVADLLKATQEYQQALYDAAGRDQKLVAIKDAKRAVLRAMLNQLAEYVNTVSNGDKAMMLSSGLKLAGEKDGTGNLKPISKLDVVTDAPEQATISIKRVPGAKAYVFEYTTGIVTNESAWISKTATEPTFTLRGLQSGVKHSFRVIAVGRNEKSELSPIVSRFIQ